MKRASALGPGEALPGRARRDAVQQLLAQATQVAVAAHCKAEIVSAFARNQHDVMAPTRVRRTT
ncbi:MAG: hypothetical protein U1E77_20065 [Inhella sp.]